MCGIWAYFTKDEVDSELLCHAFNQIQARGPDRSCFVPVHGIINFFLGFHRLSIMDPTTNGDQPFHHEHDDGRVTYTLCNGEIYNFHQLKEEHGLETVSNSDCEVIPLLYEKYGIDFLLDNLEGEFAYIIVDFDRKNKLVDVHISRDPCGVRPLFICYMEQTVALCSEIKGLVGLGDCTINPFPPGSYMKLQFLSDGKIRTRFRNYYNFDFPLLRTINTEEEALTLVHNEFTRAVTSRLEADRPLACLLSGGLDSSLVASIASKYLREHGQRLKTFSIGMPGATDKQYAELAAKFIDSDHTHIEFTKEEFIAAVEEVIRVTETYDITTVRASTGQYLLSKWISDNTNYKVVLIGDGSDELFGGYMYFHNAPTPEDFHQENCRLLKEIHLYDVLRADRGIAGNGLEARVPFLDGKFIKAVLTIAPEIRMPKDGMEKWLLRAAFDTGEYLPHEVLFRKKEAFSDGVSSHEKSWYEIVQDHADNMYTDEELEEAKTTYSHCPPPNKEALYFHKTFEKFFGDHKRVIPKYWLPLWCGNVTEPSARILDAYESSS